MNAVEIIYTNWKGVTATRTIQPIEIWFGATDYHPTEQWLLKALDIKKNEQRDFALQDVQSWQPVIDKKH